MALWVATPPFLKSRNADPARAITPELQIRLLDKKEELYMTWPERGWRDSLKYTDFNPYMVKAAIAREDQRFFSHNGTDWIGVTRAMVKNIRTCSIQQGGSTITAQLVELSYGYPDDGTVNRIRSKIFELFMTRKVETFATAEAGSKRGGKELILAAYLNRVEFGFQTVGIGEGAYFHFGKKPVELTLGESAYLAGLIRAPYGNNAYRDEENAKAARDAVIQNMLDLGMISKAEADKATFYVLKKPNRIRRKGDGFTSSAVRKELQYLEKRGWIQADKIYNSATKIVLTCDFELQNRMKNALDEGIRRVERLPKYRHQQGILQGAAIAIENETGGILASVGGRSFDILSYDCALEGSRPAGSTLKAFGFACWMDAKGKGSQNLLSNLPLSSTELIGVKNWEVNPSPHETGKLSCGNHSVWEGLAYSSNRMAQRAFLEAGTANWNRLFRAVGLSRSPLPPSSKVWLGTIDVRPVDLAAAYAVFPNGGLYKEPYLIEKIVSNGKVVFQRPQSGTQVLSRHACIETIAALREVLRVGTASSYGGKELIAHHDVAGKTGTCDRVTDVWFVGFSSEITIAVWMGIAEGSIPIVSGESGGSLAFPVWKKVMEDLPQGNAYDPLPRLLGIDAGTHPRSPRYSDRGVSPTKQWEVHRIDNQGTDRSLKSEKERISRLPEKIKIDESKFYNRRIRRT